MNIDISGKSRKALLPLALMTTTMVSYAGSSLPVLPNTLQITKSLNSKKHKVKLFAAADYKTLLFTVDGVDEKRYTLFVFDMEGQLIVQSVILNHETSILSEIPSGTYLYEVLAGDSTVESGQLKIK